MDYGNMKKIVEIYKWQQDASFKYLIDTLIFSMSPL
jgi:hypothetical protein